MNRALVIWNVIVTILLAGVLLLHFRSVRGSPPVGTIRATRMEIVDATGKTRAIFGTDSSFGTGPELSLSNTEGTKTVVLGLDEKGYGFLGFGSNDMPEGKLIVGHLGGCDTEPAPDSCFGWGIRAHGAEFSSYGFGVDHNGQPFADFGIPKSH